MRFLYLSNCTRSETNERFVVNASKRQNTHLFNHLHKFRKNCGVINYH